MAGFPDAAKSGQHGPRAGLARQDDAGEKQNVARRPGYLLLEHRKQIIHRNQFPTVQSGFTSDADVVFVAFTKPAPKVWLGMPGFFERTWRGLPPAA